MEEVDGAAPEGHHGVDEIQPQGTAQIEFVSEEVQSEVHKLLYACYNGYTQVITGKAYFSLD